jgi:DNA polymerase-3 subunit alpha
LSDNSFHRNVVRSLIYKLIYFIFRSIELNRLIHAPIDGEKSLKTKEGLNSDDLEDVKKLRKIYDGNDLQGKVLKEAVILEGSVRNTGIHAAGI